MINWKKARGTIPFAYEMMCKEIGCDLNPAYNKLYKDINGVNQEEVNDADFLNYLDRKNLVCCISIATKYQWQFVIADHTGEIVLMRPEMFVDCIDRPTTNETAIKAGLMILNDRIIELNDAKNKSDTGK